ncbi:hypothetical protein CROQUDRAFT_653609 [Cronartium quercuum f. sp. fusiforme G11]|uniref:Rab-GAP TBC domain-containing protein n=1 Tax=Cronartium quercuum f. sp. fusiforme G11 TaxID=708437 RepID=A0A9P6NSP5_9BASI|nr:hypothetical protein CROQUDRAFT_653609 [Cronartium quercuum f. sp. fusiforme G11]
MDRSFSPEEIGLHWAELMSDPLLSLARLKDRALQGQIRTLRSIYWRIFLGQLPAPAAPLPGKAQPNQVSWSIALENSRLEWECVRHRFLRAPDGKWIEDSAESHSPTSTLASSLIATSDPINKMVIDVRVNNPLSQDEANPWNVWFSDLEMRRTIHQDVIRTFPDSPYFRRIEIQNMLTNILHAYSKLHDAVGYRQGMHEVLAVIIKTLDTDALEPCFSFDTTPLMPQVLSRSYLEHDSYTLFSRLMRQVEDWYDFNCTVPARDQMPSSSTPALSVGFLPPQIAVTQPSIPAANKLVPPIVDKCWEIFHVHLKCVDPELWSHLNHLQIEPQIWGIRWLRLLFTREFSYGDSLMLWDAILAEDPCSLRLADYICIVMLLRIRDSLLDSDYGSALQTILKYPAPADGDQKMELLIYHSLILSHHPSPETAALIHQQNLETGAIAGSLPATREPEVITKPSIKTPQSHMIRRYPNLDRQSFVESDSLPVSLRGSHLSGTQGHVPDAHSLISDIAKGVHDKAESYGINKTLFGAISDFRRSYAASQTSTPLRATTLNPPRRRLSIKNGLTDPHHHDVPAEQNKHLLKELKSIYLANQDVGKAIAICVNALDRAMVTARDDTLDPGQALSLGALRHIRDVMLTGTSSGFDFNVMEPLIDFQANEASLSTVRPPSPLRLSTGMTAGRPSLNERPLEHPLTPSTAAMRSASSSPITQLSVTSLSPPQVAGGLSNSSCPQPEKHTSPSAVLSSAGCSSLSPRLLQPTTDELTSLLGATSLTQISLRKFKPGVSPAPRTAPPVASGGCLWADEAHKGINNHQVASNSDRPHSVSTPRVIPNHHRLGHTQHQSLPMRLSNSESSLSDGPDPLGVLSLSTY